MSKQYSRFLSTTPKSRPLAAKLNNLPIEENPALVVRVDPDGTIHTFGDLALGAPRLATPAEFSTIDNIEAAVRDERLVEMSLATMLEFLNVWVLLGQSYGAVLNGAAAPKPPNDSAFFYNNVTNEVVRVDPDGSVICFDGRGNRVNRPKWTTPQQVFNSAQAEELRLLAWSKDVLLGCMFGLYSPNLTAGATINGLVQGTTPPLPDATDSSVESLEEQWKVIGFED